MRRIRALRPGSPGGLVAVVAEAPICYATGMTADRTPFLPLFAMVAIVSWASAYPVVRIALAGMAPIPLAALRYAIAALVALGWLAVARPARPALRDIPQILACGVVGIALYNICFNLGETTVSAGAAGVLISAAPLMAGLLATVFLKERLSRRGWAGSALSFAGVLIVAQGQAGGVAFGAGATLVFAAAICGAVYTILQKRLVRRYGALPAIAYILIAGAVWLAPWLATGIREWLSAGRAARLSVLELGVFPAAIGYAAWAVVIGGMGAARGATMLYLLPPVAMVLAYVLTGEVPTGRTIMGGVVVMAGVIMTNTLGRPTPAAAAPATLGNTSRATVRRRVR